MIHIQFPRAWHTINAKKNKAALIYSTTLGEHCLCAFHCAKGRGRRRGTEDFPTWWGLRQVHKQARAPHPQSPGPREGHTCNPVIAQVGSQAPALLRHWRLLVGHSWLKREAKRGKVVLAGPAQRRPHLDGRKGAMS